VGSAGVAWVLLGYLHGAAPEWWLPVACGGLAGIGLRRFAHSAYGHFPTFLARWFDVGTVAIGTLVCVIATLAAHPLVYLVPRLTEAVVLSFVAAVLGSGLGALVHTHTRFGQEIGAAKEREAALEEQTLHARLRALQAQIHPHFLFNAFNSLAELTHEDPEAAERMIGDIAHLLRYSLETSVSGRVRLSQELEATDRYLGVEHARLGARLRVDRRIDPALLGTELPGLIVQPLVENAVQYAVAARTEGGRIAITVEAAGDSRCRIVVEDDGPGLPEQVLHSLAAAPSTRLMPVDGMAGEQGEAQARGTGGAGGGLANVAYRLELAYRGAAHLEVTVGELGGTRIALEVPR